MEDYTIAEEYTLPSEGNVYGKEINANIKLRSMTTQEEMKRLGHSPYVYKMFSNIIDDCLIEKPGISAYDLCIGDYQFLLYKLRIVTYGSEYKVDSICPYCGQVNHLTIDLDKLKTNKFTDSLKKHMEFELPISKKIIKLKLQTPRILDDIAKKVKEVETQSSNIESEPAILFNIISLIDTIDGQEFSEAKLETFVRELPMRDANAILNHAKAVATSIGIDTNTKATCVGCKNEYEFNLPITGEFFRPSED